jgi:hypothetical protein
VIVAIFNVVDEYLRELELDADSHDRVVERGIVRLAHEYRSPGIGVRHVIVVSSYVSEQRVIGVKRNTTLIELREFAGAQIGDQRIDERTQTRSGAIVDAIEQACERLGLECRSGAYRVAT